MTRIKTARIKHAKHKKILKAAKGFRGAKSKLVRSAKEALMHSGNYAFAGRKNRKRQKRSEWITTINAALSQESISYSAFMSSLRKKDILLDRKVLAQIIKKDKSTFDQIVKEVKK